MSFDINKDKRKIHIEFEPTFYNDIDDIVKKYNNDKTRIIIAPINREYDFTHFIKNILGLFNCYYGLKNGDEGKKDMYEGFLFALNKSIKPYSLDNIKFYKTQIDKMIGYTKFTELFNIYNNKELNDYINDKSFDNLEKYVKSINRENIVFDLYQLSTFEKTINKNVMSFLKNYITKPKYDMWEHCFIDDIYCLNKFEEDIDKYDNFVFVIHDDLIFSCLYNYFDKSYE